MTFTTFALLLLAICCSTFGNFFKKLFKKPAPFFFSLISVLATLLFFVVKFFIDNKGFTPSVDASIFPYALAFGLSFATATIFVFFAFRLGSLSITGLFVSFSLFLPTLYGIIFLNDPIGALFWVGLFLFAACLVLTNVKFLDKDREKKPISLKWIICVILGSVANGCCSIFQTAQQKAFGGKGGSELMIIALTLVTIILTVFVIIYDRKEIKGAVKTALPLATLVGLCIGGINALVILFTGQNLIPVAIFFPVLSGGGLIITFILGYLVYKERYDWLQYTGILCGLASVILLNL